MFCLSIFLVSLNFALKTFATELCIETTPCKCVMNGGQVVDLTSVGSVKRPSFIDIEPTDSNLQYTYNPCYSFDSGEKFAEVKEGNVPCKNAAGCVKTPGSSKGGAPEEHAIGLQNAYKFDKIGNFLYINYTVPGAKQTLSVKLNCSNSTDNELNVDEPETESNFHVKMTLNSKCACVNGCGSSAEPDKPSGLSTGSKLLIAFFTIALAYFIIGMVYNFCNGAKGVELVPNLDFWNELPTLIMEGVAFSVSFCGKKSSYGEV